VAQLHELSLPVHLPHLLPWSYHTTEEDDTLLKVSLIPMVEGRFRDFLRDLLRMSKSSFLAPELHPNDKKE
jgi:hypothetical protein